MPNKAIVKIILLLIMNHHLNIYALVVCLFVCLLLNAYASKQMGPICCGTSYDPREGLLKCLVERKTLNEVVLNLDEL